jgi:hypothetical protein
MERERRRCISSTRGAAFVRCNSINLSLSPRRQLQGNREKPFTPKAPS